MHIEVQRILFPKREGDFMQIKPETIHIEDIRDIREWNSEDNKNPATAIYIRSVDRDGAETRNRITIAEAYPLFCARLEELKNNSSQTINKTTKNEEHEQ